MDSSSTLKLYSHKKSGLKTFVCAVIACACVFSAPVSAFNNSEVESLRSISKVLAAKRQELIQIGNKRDALEDRLKREEGTLQLLQSSANQKKQEYRKLLTIVSNNPDIDLGDKVTEKKNLYTGQKKLVNEQKAKIRIIENNIAVHNNNYREKKSELTPIEYSYFSKKKAIVDKELKMRIDSIQVSKRVKAEGRYVCGDVKISTCKERARKNAEQVAVEQGSSVLINSMTEVKNFQLSKEIIRSEVGATLSNIKVEKKGWLGEATWTVTISATVTPSLSERIKTDMYANTENDLNSKLALNSPIGTMGGGYTPPPTPGLAKEDYPANNQESVITRDRRDQEAKEKEQQTSALAAQKAAEAAAAEAAAREAQAAARKREAEAEAREAREAPNNNEDTQTRKKRRVIGGF